MIPHYLHARAVRIWLISLMGLVALMVFVGGVTRLTESGLSIVEWKLFSGVFPPLSQEGWEAEFAEYKTSPEFQKKNFHFGVEEFKRIYWLEYLHRLLGRVIGLAFIVPFAYFLIRKALPKPLALRMATATLLVGAQGTVGWIMVASGLEDAPRVNPLKLALHLSLAFSLFSLLLWTFWQCSGRERTQSTSHALYWLFRLSTWVLVTQIVLGALVAGNDAGLSYNTYPLMDGHLIPPSLGEAWAQSHAWWANTLVVQFTHRVGAHALPVVVCVAVALAWRGAQPALKRGLIYVMAVLAIQFILGVLTLVHVVPIGLASAHQMAALLLLAAFVNVRFLAAKPQKA